MISEHLNFPKTFTIYEIATKILKMCKIGAKGIDEWTERQTCEDMSGTPWSCSWWSKFSRKCYY